MLMTFEQVSRKLTSLGIFTTPSRVKRLVQAGELKAINAPRNVRVGSISPLYIEGEEVNRYLKSIGFSLEG